MNIQPDFKRLLRQSLVALAACAALVFLCYEYVDRPVAWFVHERRFADIAALKWLTYPPPIVQAWTPAILAALMVRRAFGPFRRWELAALAACVAMVLADQFRQSLAFVFGRYWPETWVDNNPSLIRDDAYGFHPLHDGIAYKSFPSGHTARSVAVAAVFWVSYPRLRWVCMLVAALEAVALVGMNYHFVGDVVAGAFVGGIVGVYTTYFCEWLANQANHESAKVESTK